jgi:hypothetical protein
MVISLRGDESERKVREKGSGRRFAALQHREKYRVLP